MDLVRDLLDQRITDRHGRDTGRVDRIVLQLRAGAPPRVVAVEVGPSVLAARLNTTLGRWVEGMMHALGVDEGRAVRIGVRDIIDIHDHVTVDFAFGETAASTIERRLRRWIAAVPGSS
jgi:hypothetical protein